MSRSDVIPIDSRSHLEVADKKHRYAKNLRTYFKEYHRKNGLSEIVERSVPNYGNTTPSRKWSRYEPFFDWLDAEEPLPNLSECPRSVLDEDRVEYLTTEAEREQYEITIQATVGESGVTGEALWLMTQTGEPVNTGPKGWIFVLLNERMYACEKRTSTFPRFHHSSFFAGAGVSAAGMLVCVAGKLTKLFPHSGHYRPHDRHLYSLLAFLRAKNVDLSSVQVDVQRVMKLSRQQDKDGAKAKKTESAFYLDGETAFNFLKSKTGFQELGVLRQINKRRLEYSEGEPTPSVRARAISNPSVAVPTVESTLVKSTQPLHSMTIDTLGALPVLNKSDSGDSTSPNHQNQKQRLSLIAPSNRSSLNRLSLNSTGASTVGSASPFCSPVAQYQYPLRSSSGSAGDLLADAAYAGSSSVFAGTGKGSSGKDSPGGELRDRSNNNDSNYSMRGSLFCGSNSADGDFQSGSYDGEGAAFDAAFEGEITRSGWRSSADARARVLSTLLYVDGNKASSPSSTQANVGKSKGTLPSSPPIPPGGRTSSSAISVNNNSSSSTGTLYVHTGIASVTPVTKIPVAVPLKKVTSYTSISSSYGSASYLQQHYGSRSRSASKTEELEHDLRVLLGDSPVVHAPVDYNYYNYNYEPGGNSPTNHNSGPASTCNSRGRSRVSSFNPPYIPTSAALYANSNIAISSNAGDTPLPFKLHSGQNTRNNSLHSASLGSESAGGSRGHTPVMSVNHSPADKVSPRVSLGSSRLPSVSPSIISTRLEAFTPTAHLVSSPMDVNSVATNNITNTSTFIPTEDISIPSSVNANALLAESAANGSESSGVAVECPGSPVPSFASSLSSTDSLPNMMLDYVMSPGGTLLHFDGLYEETQGDDYHDYIYGVRDNP